MSFDYAIHSDFLIHWTGRDIEPKLNLKNGKPNPEHWYYSNSKTSKQKGLEEKYLKRLKDILTYGLWMTSEKPIEAQTASEPKVETFLERQKPPVKENIIIPPTPKCCFTELKISQSRTHAKQYGRLGIGFKRGFLFRRLGRPLAYYVDDKTRDVFLEQCAQDLKNKDMLNFFKPMNSKGLNYDLYSESEWRIIYLKELLDSGQIIDPKVSKDEKVRKYYNSLSKKDQKKLKYLIPVSGDLSMIIYPSLEVKNKAQQEKEYGIVEEIERIKSNMNEHLNRVEGKGSKKGNWPIELDLDACRNF